MLEGLPPNGAAYVMRLETDEATARLVADTIVETFDPTETAAAAFEKALVLRQKLGDDPRQPAFLKTVRGSGYVLTPGNEA